MPWSAGDSQPVSRRSGRGWGRFCPARRGRILGGVGADGRPGPGLRPRRSGRAGSIVTVQTVNRGAPSRA